MLVLPVRIKPDSAGLSFPAHCVEVRSLDERGSDLGWTILTMQHLGYLRIQKVPCILRISKIYRNM